MCIFIYLFIYMCVCVRARVCVYIIYVLVVNPYDKTSTTTDETTFMHFNKEIQMKPKNRDTPHYEPTIHVHSCD